MDGWETILSFWDGLFSGVNSLLNFQGVDFLDAINETKIPKPPFGDQTTTTRVFRQTEFLGVWCPLGLDRKVDGHQEFEIPPVPGLWKEG